MNNALTFVCLLVLAVLVYFGYTALFVPVTDYKNLTYIVRDEPVTLKGGVASTPAAPGSASMITTKYFGNDVRGDVNNDGAQDVAFILTQTGGGSGTFYYLAVALSDGKGHHSGTNAVFLGDRIVINQIDILSGQISVDMQIHREGEALSSPPSLRTSKRFTTDQGKLVAS